MLKLVTSPFLTIAIYLAATSPILAQSCSDLGSAGEAVECLEGQVQSLQDTINKLSRDLEAISARPAPEGAAGVPRGAIVVFDEKCPPLGWELYDRAGGRVIVGAGHHANKDENGNPLTIYQKHRLNGGEEKHKLTVEEIPSHDHPIRRTDTSAGDGNFVRFDYMGSPNNKSTGTGTAKVGGSQPHNNMPPYIALYFCKKT